MPVDANGIRADVVMAGESTIGRMNIGRPYEIYFGAVSNEIMVQIRNRLNISDRGNLELKPLVKQVTSLGATFINGIYDYIIGYFKIVNENQFIAYNAETDMSFRAEFVARVAADGVYIQLPTDIEKEMKEVVKEIESSPYKPVYGPVRYIGNSGKEVTTYYPVRVGTMYCILLEKTADDWSAVSSAKSQHFGILTPITKSDKYSSPIKESPVRIIGETEGRTYAAACGREAVAEMMDRSNNQSTHRMICTNIMRAKTPTNIPEAVDRSIVPLGNARPVQLLNSKTVSMGFVLDYVPESK